tara:strand:- start:413 stop:610 length:198 start_codon:yes stop_codon:yes gene_type:complete
MKKKKTKKEKNFEIFKKMCQHSKKVRKAMKHNSDKNKIPPRWVMKDLMDSEFEFNIEYHKKNIYN